MQWHELYPKEVIPTPEALADYIGEAKSLWLQFSDHVQAHYGVKPKFTYSVCSGKPGWNVKYQKGGKALGTFYPEEGAFSALVVLGYKLDPAMSAILPALSAATAKMYQTAGDYMKMGKWMMLRVDSPEALEDLKKIIDVKMAAA
jgi:hypothetical protein